MERKYVVWLPLLVVFISQFALIPSTNATEIITLEPIADATVSNATESDNNTELKVGCLYGVSWITYIMFDLSSIPSNAIIESVKLKLKSKTFISEGNRWVRAINSSTEWIEDEVTWDNKPERDRWLDTEWVELLKEWYVWDCTTALTTKREKLSIALELLSGMDGYVIFYARESEYKPQLEVKYSLSQPPPKIPNLRGNCNSSCCNRFNWSIVSCILFMEKGILQTSKRLEGLLKPLTF
ncbi:MAG: DNRLRE domain-containing protein [Thermoproteota archaeon]